MHSLFAQLYRLLRVCRVFRGVLLFVATAPSLSAQLKVRGIEQLSQLAAHTKSVLHGRAAATSADLWHMMVAHLRLGQAHEARSLLVQYVGCEQPELILAAFATLQRSTGENLLDDVRRRTLQRALHKREQLPFTSYAEVALQIHGRYCLAQLDDDALRGQHERIATSRLLALESETWQPGRGHYRAIPCRGRLMVPAAADTTLLQPLTFGMLLASGDRLGKHLRNTLAAARSGSKLRWQAQPHKQRTAALLLTAAAQVGEERAIEGLFATVVRQRATDPATAARDLNAAMQAVTGVRLAAGGGLSANWLRVTPWLPEGCGEVAIQGVLAMAREFTVSLRREQQNRALHVTVRLHAGAVPSAPLVVGNRWQQFVTEVHVEQPFECELPGEKRARGDALPANAEANDDALHRFGFRCR